jgi:hypothetical protein
MYQSTAPLQTLEDRRFNVGKLSVDRDKSVYTAWHAGFQEHRIRLFPHKQLLYEAERLLELERKVDHPPTKGSKDTSDAAAGAYYNAMNSDERMTVLCSNGPAIYGLSAVSSDPRNKLDFNFLGDYLKRCPRPTSRTFDA